MTSISSSRSYSIENNPGKQLPRLFYTKDQDFLWRPSHPESNTGVKTTESKGTYHFMIGTKSYIAASKVKPVPYNHEDKLVKLSFLGCFFNSLHKISYKSDLLTDLRIIISSCFSEKGLFYLFDFLRSSDEAGDELSGFP